MVMNKGPLDKVLWLTCLISAWDFDSTGGLSESVGGEGRLICRAGLEGGLKRVSVSVESSLPLSPLPETPPYLMHHQTQCLLNWLPRVFLPTLFSLSSVQRPVGRAGTQVGWREEALRNKPNCRTFKKTSLKTPGLLYRVSSCARVELGWTQTGS